MKDLVSFIVVSWNRYDDLLETIRMINQQSYHKYEIIVIDNNSDDARYSTIKSEPNVVYLKLDANRDRIIAANEGFKVSKGKYIVSLDDDSFPGTDSISSAIERFKADKKLGIIAMDIYDYDTYFGKQLSITRDEFGSIKDAFIGCAGMFRRELLNEIGMWENIPVCPFELSFSIRTIDAGYRIKQFKDVYVYHKLSTVSRITSNRLKVGAEATFKFQMTYNPNVVTIYNMLRSYIINDYLRKDWYGIQAYLSALLESPKRYPLSKDTIKRIRFNPQVEGKRILDYNEVEEDETIKRILLIRTRPMQLLAKCRNVLNRRFPSADIELLTHPTTSDLYEDMEVYYYPYNEHFSYGRLNHRLSKQYDMIAFMGDNYKLLGGYENIQLIAHKLKLPLVAVSPNGNVYEYTKSDYIKVRNATIIGNILTPIIMLVGLFCKRPQRKTYYWEYLKRRLK